MRTLLRLVMIVAVLMGTALPLVHPGVTHATGAGAIQGTLFFDANADGVRNAGEAGLAAGATIELYVLDNGSQVYLRSTTTIADGTYQFDGLEQNVYVVTEANAFIGLHAHHVQHAPSDGRNHSCYRS